jgi:prevent-host-death family protein
MKIAPLADVKARLSAYLDECETEGPIVITRNGKAAAILLAPKDEEDLERLILAHSRRFQALLTKSRQSIRAGKGVYIMSFGKRSLGVIKSKVLHQSENEVQSSRVTVPNVPVIQSISSGKHDELFSTQNSFRVFRIYLWHLVPCSAV